MVELLLPAAYYLLMLAGSVSLGKVILLLAGGGQGLAEDERATGLASITGLVVVGIALAAEIFLLRGAAFPTVIALGGIATIGSRAFLFKKPLLLSTPHFDELMDEASLQESSTPSQAISPGAERLQQALSWNYGKSASSAPAKTVAAIDSAQEPPASQKIGEVIRLQRKPSAEAKPKPKTAESDGFSEIKW